MAKTSNVELSEVRKDLILSLSRTYTFDDQEISTLDLSPVAELTANDLIQAQKILTSRNYVATNANTDLYFCMTLASIATGFPVEFFLALKMRDANAVKNRVASFTVAQVDDPQKVKLSRSYTYKDKTITELDLSGLEELNAQAMTSTQVYLTSERYVTLLPETDIFYALVLAAKGTGNDVEFFRSLNIQDAYLVKNAVAAFF